MANTFTQIHIHCVFAVRDRFSLILPSFREELFRYITGIVQNNNHKLIAINGMPDHLHIFIRLRPTQSLSDLMQDVKGSSSIWINKKKLIVGKFEWQSGFGAFSYSSSQIDSVIKYIQNQEQHHKSITFIDEYLDILKEFAIPFDERYIFKKV